MKVRLIVPAVALLLAGAVVSLADNPQMGTWKLNEAKSKFSKGATKNNTVVYEAAGDQIKVTVDGVDGDGNAVHSEWTGKFDGKFYAVNGDPTSDVAILQDKNNLLAIMKDGSFHKPLAQASVSAH